MAMFAKFRYSRTYWRFWKHLLDRFAPEYDPGEYSHANTVVDGIHLDNNILSLVTACWDVGIETVNSCQGDADVYVAGHRQGYAYLTVTTEVDAFVINKALLSVQPTSERENVLIETVFDEERDRYYYHVSFNPTVLNNSASLLKVIHSIKTQ